MRSTSLDIKILTADTLHMTDLMPEFLAPADPDPLAPDENAPFGYTIDRRSGERRPKKLPGRPKAQEADIDSQPETPQLRSVPIERQPDREPGTVRLKNGKTRAPRPEPETPAFRAGPIAKGVNRLYLKGGKLVRGFDPEVGQAMIDATKKESEDDVTVGEAWEELARTNPRIRRVLLKLITGGAWGQLFMAHAPILLAVVMKPAVIKHIPFAKVIESLAEAEDDTPEGEGGLPGGMTVDDASQAMELAKAQMEKMGFQMSPEMMQQAAAFAGISDTGNTPRTTVRAQSRNTGPRAKRRK